MRPIDQEAIEAPIGFEGPAMAQPLDLQLAWDKCYVSSAVSALMTCIMCCNRYRLISAMWHPYQRRALYASCACPLRGAARAACRIQAM